MAQKSSAIPNSISSAIQKADGLQMDRSFDQALDAFGQAVQMIQQQRQLDKPLQASKARCHANMGQIFLQKQDWDSAHSEFSHSAGIYELLQQPVSMAEALCGMAKASQGLGEQESALQHFHQALDIFEQQQENGLSSKALIGIAEISQQHENTDDTRECLQKIVRLSSDYACEMSILRSASKLAGQLQETELLIELQQKQIEQLDEKISATATIKTVAPPLTENTDTTKQEAKPAATAATSASSVDQTLEQLIKEKNDELRHFINKAAHDMKEPLRMISSFGSLLKSQYGEKLGEGGMEFLEFITDANQRMNILLQKLLEYVKVGTSDAPVEAVNLDDAVILVSGDLKKEIEESGMAITTANLPEVQGQREYVKLLFRHLMDNAIKYNKSESPSLHISGEETDTAHVISFQDNGIGIDEKQHEKIFEIFIRLHSRSDYPGSGIGLAVAEKVMDLCGGKVDVVSTPDEGATFRVHFPK